MVTLAFAQAGSVLIEKTPESSRAVTRGSRLTPRTFPTSSLGCCKRRTSTGCVLPSWLWCSWSVRGLSAPTLVMLWPRRGRMNCASGSHRNSTVLRETPDFRHRWCPGHSCRYGLSAPAEQCHPEACLGGLHTDASRGSGGVGGWATGGRCDRWVVYTFLDQRLTAFASSDAVSGLPDVLRIPLSQPLFILGTLFILVVLFLPGGIAGMTARLTRSRRKSEDPRAVLEELG